MRIEKPLNLYGAKMKKLVYTIILLAPLDAAFDVYLLGRLYAA